MEQRNLILAIVASVAILLGFELLYNAPNREYEAQQQAAQEEAAGGQTAQSGAPRPDGAGVPGGAPGAADAPGRKQVIADTPRVEIDTPRLTGSISLQGARVDDLTLRTYHTEADDSSPRIDLLSPKDSRQAYFADFGWVGVAGDVALPDGETVWESSGGPLTPDNPVTLSWTSEQGLTFERTFEVDENYMFTVTQTVTNASGETVSLAPYGLISRRGKPDTLGYWILHEGPIGVFNGTLENVSYSDVRDEADPWSRETEGGWIGITDKYWLVSLVPSQNEDVKARFAHREVGGVDKYQADFLYPTMRVGAGESLSQTSRLFAGAKEVTLLDQYSEEYGIPHFDKAVDFGWFYFLTKPIFQALHFFAQVTGNFGVAILVLVVILKIILFPLANKSYRSMAKMRKLQPEMQKLRERFGDDKQRLNQEMMALYKREGANPASGCLPILLQIPIFFALYKVLFVTIEMRHAPFVGYLQDLSAQDPTSILNVFGLMPWGVPELGPLNILNVGFLPLIMGISMYGQQMLNPQPADPMQQRIFAMLPVVFTFILSTFPAGLVLYWTSNNILTIAQQYVIMRRAGMPIGGKQEAQAAGAGGGSSGGGSSGGQGVPDLMTRISRLARKAGAGDKVEALARKTGQGSAGAGGGSKTAGKGSGKPGGGKQAAGKPSSGKQTGTKQTGAKQTSGKQTGGKQAGQTSSGAGKSGGQAADGAQAAAQGEGPVLEGSATEMTGEAPAGSGNGQAAETPAAEATPASSGGATAGRQGDGQGGGQPQKQGAGQQKQSKSAPRGQQRRSGNPAAKSKGRKGGGKGKKGGGGRR